MTVAGVSLNGGTEADRDAVLAAHQAYLKANTGFDWEALTPIFSDREDAAFFNLNGFTYNGKAHWTRLWQYYGGQVRSTFWTPYDISGVVDANTAVIWCHRRCRRNWVGDDTPVKGGIHYDGTEFMSRSTMIFRKEDGTWRVMHVHFSRGEEGKRPGDV